MAKQGSDEFRGIAAEAEAHFRAGRLAEAETCYRAALAIVPRVPAVTQNLGVALAAQGRQREAIGYFEEALRFDPSFASAHYNRAVALMSLGARQEAIAAFESTARLEPEHYEAHRALGFLWLSEGNRGKALDHLARTYELRRGDDRTAIALKSLTMGTRHKLAHDAEQFQYLSQRTRERLCFELRARSYRRVAEELTNAPAPLSDGQITVLGDDYNTPIHLCATPEVTGDAVNRRLDVAALSAQFNTQGATVADDLLTPEALNSLRRFLLESTIWHDFSHIDGFVASYLEDGLACPLLLQIADELRHQFPDILAEHPLSQAWAFKGLKAQSAIDVHADDAVVSVNFWITSAQANLDPERGGLVVWLTAPPKDWEIEGYEMDKDRIVTFLEQDAESSLVVPYRQNRAVLFRSRLFHSSDRPEFAAGYENHRINLTLLYG